MCLETFSVLSGELASDVGHRLRAADDTLTPREISAGVARGSVPPLAAVSKRRPEDKPRGAAHVLISAALELAGRKYTDAKKKH